MKIGINALGLSSGSLGGMEVYFLNLIKGIAPHDSGHNYLIWVNNRKVREMLAPYVQSNVQLAYVSQLYTYIAGGLVLLFSRPKLAVEAAGKFFSNQPIPVETAGIIGKIVDLNRKQPDVVHFPFSIIDPSFSDIKAPIVLTIPDIQHEYCPEYFDAPTLSVRKSLYRSSAGRADVIITISEASKRAIIEKFGEPAEKIVVTYPGCSEDFRKIVDPNALAAIREKYSLPDEFVFYPAGTWPHKNHIKLLEALSVLRSKHDFQKRLIMTGIPQNNHDRVLESVKRFGLESQVRFLNVVPFADLPAIYNMATLMVFPSLFEGFGIPLVEAMSVGLPIACSDRTSIPEVVGEAGVYFDPDNAEDIADRIYQLWNDTELKESLVKKGFEQVKLFNWKEMTRRTIEAYELASKKRK
ncbi:MAG: glycosyltransferase family 1 protein [Acidobacteriota bacterium]